MQALRYTAPELRIIIENNDNKSIIKEDIDHEKSDIWSLGLIILELISNPS